MGKYIHSILTFVIVDIIGAIEGAYGPEAINVTSEAAPHSVEGLFHKLFQQNIAALRQANPAKQGGPMPGPQQEYKGLPPGLEEYMKMQRQGSDTYYEPYWNEGEWVFKRKPFTARPPNYLPLYSNVKPEFVKECADSCPRIYAGYGPVCGHYTSMSSGQLKTKQFYSLCHMLFDNCIMTKTRHGNGEAAWRPALHGSCHLRWKKQEIDSRDIIRHAKELLEALMPKELPTTPALNVVG